MTDRPKDTLETPPPSSEQGPSAGPSHVDDALEAMKRDPESCPTPTQLVAALDRHIVGQTAAKRAVAVAMRNRWRRGQLTPTMQKDVIPKNILMIGPTGVGKTEIARRLARLTGAPFVKVEATKFTEVGYHGRDVESMVRDLVAQAVNLVKDRERERVKTDAAHAADERVLDLLLPKPSKSGFGIGGAGEDESYQAIRERWRTRLQAGELETRRVEVSVNRKSTPVIMGPPGMENMDVDFGGMLERIMPKQSVKRDVPVAEARQIFLDEESERLLDPETVNAEAIRLAENVGIIFIDEIDKIVGGDARGPDVSRQGVQRDLLPIVEGATIQTRHGMISTQHVLFIAAGAFHQHKPSDLMPELQGRFPIRVELSDLTRDDLARPPDARRRPRHGSAPARSACGLGRGSRSGTCPGQAARASWWWRSPCADHRTRAHADVQQPGPAAGRARMNRRPSGQDIRMSVKSKLGRKAATSVVKHTAHGTVSKARRDPMRSSRLIGFGAVLGALAGFLAGRAAGEKAAKPAPYVTPVPSPPSPVDAKLQPDPGMAEAPAAAEPHLDPDAS